MDGPVDLERFVLAQDAGGTYAAAVAELAAGRKASHWMWFVFPQIAGLGSSQMSRYYAISGVAEARAYLAHPVLGARLVEVTGIVGRTGGSTARQIFGSVDAQKLQSCMTLFHRVAPAEPGFAEVLALFFDGRADDATDRLIDRDSEQ